MLKKCFVFDVDGTLFNTEWRVPLKAINKEDFNEKCGDDPPVPEIVFLAQVLNDVFPVVIVTTREKRYKKKTLDLLDRSSVPYAATYFAENYDERNDGKIKADLLEEMKRDGWEPFAVFDDRQIVVDMWREKGYKCLQCQPGDF